MSEQLSAEERERYTLDGYPVPEGWTRADVMDRLRRKVAAGNRPPSADPAAKLEDLQQQVRALEDLAKEQRDRASWWGLDPTGLRFGHHVTRGLGAADLTVVEMVADYWHGDRWRVECRVCGRTGVVDGDDLRPELLHDAEHPYGAQRFKLQSCADLVTASEGGPA